MMFQRKTASHTSILEKAGRCFISKSPPPTKNEKCGILPLWTDNIDSIAQAPRLFASLTDLGCQ